MEKFTNWVENTPDFLEGKSQTIVNLMDIEPIPDKADLTTHLRMVYGHVDWDNLVYKLDEETISLIKKHQVIRNLHGVEIKKCCASCRFKDLTRLITVRFCTQHHKSVKPNGCCKQWAMSEQMEAAGRGGGKVKCRAYLRYLLEVREDESLADQLGIRTPHKTIDQIRKEFEKNHGSIYLELKN
jgi:hypothetical protein